MSNLRPVFSKLIGNWSSIQDVKDIPARVKRIEKWAETVNGLNTHEQILIDFMKDVQATREAVRRKPDVESEDDQD